MPQLVAACREREGMECEWMKGEEDAMQIYGYMVTLALFLELNQDGWQHSPNLESDTCGMISDALLRLLRKRAGRTAIKQ
jgi:hypothetical protein